MMSRRQFSAAIAALYRLKDIKFMPGGFQYWWPALGAVVPEAAAVAATAPAFAVTTRSYDNLRSGANTHETILTPAAVKTRGVRKLFQLNLPGSARGCEAQPLIVPGVKMANGVVRDICYVATMYDQIFAFDANTGTRLWIKDFGNSIKSTSQIDGYMINDYWGILSTPVIDPVAGVLYLCAWSSPDFSAAKGQHFLYAIRLSDGANVHQPINLEGVTYDPGHGLPVLAFESAPRKQRCSLMLAGGMVYIGFGTISESSKTARGWLIAVNAATFKNPAAWTTTARGYGGGLWNSGSGPCADDNGNIYLLTGNGDFDGVTDFGESIVKLRYQDGALKVIDWWTPWTDDGRDGGAAMGETAPRPSNVMTMHIDDPVTTPVASGAWSDMDFGSGGLALVPDYDAILAAGKDGILYTAPMSNLGQTQPADLAPAAVPANYAKLKTPPIFYTYYSPSPPDPSVIAMLNVLPNGRTRHMHGSPLVWRSAAHGLMHFCWGENGNLRAWSLAPDGSSKFLANGAEVASVNAPVPTGGMAGGNMTLSANGDKDGIVWASIPYIDANKHVSPGRFLAYDAATFGAYPDGTESMPPLWDSQQWNWMFSHNKFNRPVVWNGKVYMPTYDGNVWVLGL